MKDAITKSLSTWAMKMWVINQFKLLNNSNDPLGAPSRTDAMKTPHKTRRNLLPLPLLLALLSLSLPSTPNISLQVFLLSGSLIMKSVENWFLSLSYLRLTMRVINPRFPPP